MLTHTYTVYFIVHTCISKRPQLPNHTNQETESNFLYLYSHVYLLKISFLFLGLYCTISTSDLCLLVTWTVHIYTSLFPTRVHTRKWYDPLANVHQIFIASSNTHVHVSVYTYTQRTDTNPLADKSGQNSMHEH
jgi:hypothetical protein